MFSQTIEFPFLFVISFSFVERVGGFFLGGGGSDIDHLTLDRVPHLLTMFTCLLSCLLRGVMPYQPYCAHIGPRPGLLNIKTTECHRHKSERSWP